MLNSLRDLYRIGPGPSSSHTIGPFYAARDFLMRIKTFGLVPDRFVVTLYGSLALTGRGHLTDDIIKKTLGPDRTAVEFDILTPTAHPNTLKIAAFNRNAQMYEETYLSLGGGTIATVDQAISQDSLCYPFDDFEELCAHCKNKHLSLRQVALEYEGEAIIDYIDEVFNSMEKVIVKSLATEGEVAGCLHVKRIAKSLNLEAKNLDPGSSDRRILEISSYAYATSEANAAGDMIVTAPTCGSAGVLPAVLYYLHHDLHYPRDKIENGLIAAGFIGLVIKKNATISGAVGGCQAEIGSATAMAAAALCAANDLDLEYLDYAAEVGLEHQLGLTCDPVAGYVAIPCIERNSIAALKAYDAYLFAKHLLAHRKNSVTFDEVVEVMLETGQALNSDFRETSIGGLAKLHSKKRG